LRDLRARCHGRERRDGVACVRTLCVELIPLSLQASQVLDLLRHHNLIERHIGTAGAREGGRRRRGWRHLVREEDVVGSCNPHTHTPYLHEKLKL
jgi:hypothetical protein